MAAGIQLGEDDKVPCLTEKLSLKRLSEINEVNLIMQIVLKKSETTYMYYHYM